MSRATEVGPEGLRRLTDALGTLPSTYKRVLAPARELQAKVLGVPVGEFRTPRAPGRFATEAVVVFGEVLIRDDTALGVLARVTGESRYRRNPQGGVSIVAPEEAPAEVIVFSLGPQVNGKTLKDFVEKLGEASGIEFAPFRYASNRFTELVEEGMKSPIAPDEAERSAARRLTDKRLRILAIAIKSSGGLLVSDAAKQLPAELKGEVDQLIADLRADGLVDTEVVVICTKTSNQVARAASRKLLERSSASGVTCACGTPLKDERIEEALTVTSLARRLLDGSRWMSILLLDELLNIGIPLDRILIEQQSGGDEMDCFADVSGELTFFELKDKEFSLGNAYSFGAKVAISRPEHRVIITTEQVGNDAKDHFARAEVSERRSPYAMDQEEPQGLKYIEGIDSLHSDLEELASEIFTKDGLALLSDVMPLASLDPQVFIDGLRNRVPEEDAAEPIQRAASTAGKRRAPRPARQIAQGVRSSQDEKRGSASD